MQILFRRRNHKEEHFERLFAEMYPRLVRFATTLMSNTEEAKDIVSETMEQAWKEFDQLKENTRSAWLYATVRNGCLNRLKHLNVEANQALIIEDSEKGIAAGVAAGVEVWAIKDNRFGMDQGAAKGLLDNLVGVLDLLK